jgi:hypothetical protein
VYVFLSSAGIALSTKYSPPNYCCLWRIAQKDEDEDVAENNAIEENDQNPNYAVRNALIATVFAR